MELRKKQPKTEMEQLEDLIAKDFDKKKITSVIECDARTGNITYIKTENKDLLTILKTLKIIS